MNPEMMAAIEAERARLANEDRATLELIRQQAAASGRPSQYNHAIQLAAQQLQARQDAAMLEFARGLVGTPVPNTPLGGVAKGPNSPRNLPVSAGLGKGPPTAARPHAISHGVPFNKGVQTPGPQHNVEMGPATISSRQPDFGPSAGGSRLAAGNIDLANRPLVRNPDGTGSTIRSISVGMDGQTYLLPTVSEDGRVVSDEEAIRMFRGSGRHLGAFTNSTEADRYAEQAHQQQAGQYAQPMPAPQTTARGPQYNVEMGPVTIDPPRYNVEMGPATIDPPQEPVEMGTARAREGSSSRGMPQRGVSPEFLRRLAEERRRRGRR